MKQFFILIYLFSLIFVLQLNTYSQIATTPTIDGDKEAIWDNATYFVPTKLVKNTPGDEPVETDLSGKFWTLWDTDHFYLYIEVYDDLIFTGENPDHQNDNIEVYFDLNNSKQSVYDGIDDDQIRFISGVDTVNSKRSVKAQDLEFAQKTIEGGYAFEICFPWAALTSESFEAAVNKEIGFDLMITDNDGTPKKDYIYAWNATTNDAWQFTSIFGTMKLLASGTTKKIIGNDQPAEHDEYQIDETKITSIIHVDKNDPNAADDNDGSNTSPLKTIGKALDAAADSAGNGVATKVLIAAGTYREHGLYLKKIGNPYLFMNTEVVIEGEEKGQVIIKGSEVWNDGWTLHENRTYKHEWNYSISVEKPWGDRGPKQEIATRREMVFVNGYWMKQVMQISEMNDNCFYVDETNDLIYVKVADTIDFESADKEIGLHGDEEDAPWPPVRLFHVPIDKDKVVLRNLTFQHANMRLSEATVKVQGWKVLIEDCEITWNNGLGINIAACEQVTLRNNIIDNNGGSGITTWGTKDLTFIGNSTSHNNWRGHLGLYHSHAIGGIKFHHTTNVLVENHISNNNWAPGLWTDLEILNITYNNCTVKNNYGPGFLIEISKDVYLNNCTIERNIPGIRCHSSHDVYIDGCNIKGNAVQFTVYRDHRDFTSDNWTSQFDGRVWDKTPYNWVITNSIIEAVDDPEWQSYADKKMPSWIHYTNPGYQAFWHFSHDDYMSTFFGAATIAGQNNQWIHPTTSTPFTDDEDNALTTAEWEEWIAGFATGDKAIEQIDEYAKNDDASPLTIELMNSAGAEEVNLQYLEEYKIIIADEDGILDLNALNDAVKKANAFAQIRSFAENNNASELSITMLLDAGVTFRTDRMEFYKTAIADVEKSDLPDIPALQTLINGVTAIGEGINSDYKICMYPNPATRFLYVNHLKGTETISVFNIAGKSCFQSDVNAKKQFQIDVSGLPQGIYIIRISDNQNISTSFFMKQ